MDFAFESISENRNQAPADASSPVAYQTIEVQTTKLLALVLLTFDAKNMNWALFRDAFDATVNQTSIPNVQKLTYLHGLLEGKRKSAIEIIPITSVNYAEALSILKKQFSNDDLIRRSLCTQL